MDGRPESAWVVSGFLVLNLVNLMVEQEGAFESHPPPIHYDLLATNPKGICRLK